MCASSSDCSREVMANPVCTNGCSNAVTDRNEGEEFPREQAV